MRKKIYYLLILVILLFTFIFYLINRSPFIDSEIGNKNYFEQNILNFNKELLLIKTSENSYLNEFAYGLFYKDNYNLNSKNLNLPLASFLVTYEENDLINSIEYKYNPNNKGVLELEEFIIKNTFISLTDAGYKEIKRYLNLPKENENIRKNLNKTYITSGKTINISYDKMNNVYVLKIK